MKKLLLTALLLMISGRVFATTFYEQYGCEYTCGKTYKETITDNLGFRKTFVVLPCKYTFCYTKNGQLLKFRAGYDKTSTTKPYLFHFRFLVNE